MYVFTNLFQASEANLSDDDDAYDFCGYSKGAL